MASTLTVKVETKEEAIKIAKILKKRYRGNISVTKDGVISVCQFILCSTNIISVEELRKAI